MATRANRKKFNGCSAAGEKIAKFTGGQKHDIERSVADVRRITEGVDADDDELRFAAYDSFSGFKISAVGAGGNPK